MRCPPQEFHCRDRKLTSIRHNLYSVPGTPDSGRKSTQLPSLPESAWPPSPLLLRNLSTHAAILNSGRSFSCLYLCNYLSSLKTWVFPFQIHFLGSYQDKTSDLYICNGNYKNNAPFLPFQLAITYSTIKFRYFTIKQNAL